MKNTFGHGNPNAKLMVIGEAPGYHEDATSCSCNGTVHGIPFQGPSGRILDSMLLAAGSSRSEVFCDNVVTIRPPGNKINKLKELGVTVDQFYPRLFEAIKRIKPNCILALGNTPLYALTGKSGISKYRGSILYSSTTGVKVVPTIHPDFLLHSDGDGDEGGSFKYSTRVYMQLDVNRAVTEARSAEYDVPKPHIQIIRDSGALYSFLQKFKSHKRFAVDIESCKSIPNLIAIAPSKDYAVSIQLVNIEEVDYRIPYRELAQMNYMLAEFFDRDDIEIIGQNFKFDQKKLESVTGIHIRRLFADTMLLQATVNPEFPKSLAFTTSVYTRQPFYKDDGKEFRYGKDPIEQFFIYNGTDACVTFEVFDALIADAREYGIESFFFDYRMKLHDFYMDLEAEGFKTDEVYWSELITKYKGNWDRNQKRLQELAGYDLNVSSPKQVFQYITRDLGLPPRESTNEETLVAYLGNQAKSARDRESLNLIIDTRRIRKTIGTYLAAYPDGDGRMRTSYRIIGTETGRSSTSKCDPPVRPIKGFGLPFQVMTKHGEIGGDFRKAFIADEGCVIFECDLSQAEARVVSLLSEDYETLNLFDTQDIHTVTASWIFGCQPIRDDKNVTEEKRFIGKTTRHAGNYGEGKRRLMLDVNASARRFGINISISEKEAQNILNAFHGRTPKIRKVYHVAVQAALKQNNKVLVNAFGQRRKFNDRMGDSLFREAYAFIPSSTVKDHLSMAGLRIRDRIAGVRFIVESHDAFVAMVRRENVADTAKIFKEEFEKPIDFSRCTLKRGALVIPCEIKIGENYKELKEYRVEKRSGDNSSI